MRYAFLFPGQGSQVVGMGHDIAHAYPAARAMYQLADDALGWSVSTLCFHGPDTQLTATDNTQPALVATSLAVLAALAGDVSRITAYTTTHAVAVAGHSLGEYSALAAAGSLTPADALRLVRRRGELMAAATSGGMAAVIGLDDDVIDRICAAASTPDEMVVVANYNTPGQTVISGAPAAIARASSELKSAGAKLVKPLNVSGAFHSPLMRDAADALTTAVTTMPFAPPQLPVISNITATPLADTAAIRAELPAQMTSPVRWVQTIQYLVNAGVTHFVEIGAGDVLKNMMKRIAPDAITVSVKDVASLEAYTSAL